MNLFQELSESFSGNIFDEGKRAGSFSMLFSDNPHKDDDLKASQWELGRKSTFPTEYLTKPCG
jgi:hypothetical protein